MEIDVKNLTKRYERLTVLDRVNLQIRDKEFIGLLGPSGSGKTTLLRILAGLEIADEGAVEIDGRDSRTLLLDERKIGFVFQHYALFNHMTVFQNVAFGLEVKPGQARKSTSESRRVCVSCSASCSSKRLLIAFPHSYREDNGSGWRWREHLLLSRRCYFLMSRLVPGRQSAH